MAGTLRPRPVPGPAPEPGDLTVIFLTINLVPDAWADYQRRTLLAACEGYPVITISRLPMDWGPGITNVLQEVPDDYWARTQNVYRQMVVGAELAETPYVAFAEDDCLYPREHFTAYRPPLDTFAFNHSRWCQFAWETRRPFYYLMPTDANCLLIAPRELLIKRLKPYPEISRRVMEHLQEPATAYHTFEPVLCFYHDQGNDNLERSHRKKPWPVVAYQIPRWGKAKEAIRTWC